MKRIAASEANHPPLPDGYFYSDTLVFMPEELFPSYFEPTPAECVGLTPRQIAAITKRNRKNEQRRRTFPVIPEYLWRVSYGPSETP